GRDRSRRRRGPRRGSRGEGEGPRSPPAFRSAGGSGSPHYARDREADPLPQGATRERGEYRGGHGRGPRSGDRGRGPRAPHERSDRGGGHGHPRRDERPRREPGPIAPRRPESGERPTGSPESFGVGVFEERARPPMRERDTPQRPARAEPPR